MGRNLTKKFEINADFESWYEERKPEPLIESLFGSVNDFIQREYKENPSFHGVISIELNIGYPEV